MNLLFQEQDVIWLLHEINPKATHLMFIDADINFNCQDILHMLQHDKDIVVGAYPKKDLDWRELERKIKQGKQRTVDELKALGSKYALNFDWYVNPKLMVEKYKIKMG